MKLYETITAENWVQGSRGCLIYHLISIVGSLVLDTPEYGRLNGAIKLLFPERIGYADAAAVQIFNDHPDTGLEDVLRVCKVADV